MNKIKKILMSTLGISTVLVGGCIGTIRCGNNSNNPMPEDCIDLRDVQINTTYDKVILGDVANLQNLTTLSIKRNGDTAVFLSFSNANGGNFWALPSRTERYCVQNGVLKDDWTQSSLIWTKDTETFDFSAMSYYFTNITWGGGSAPTNPTGIYLHLVNS